MKGLSSLLVGGVVAISLSVSVCNDAWAARMGGGKSFGSRPSYSMPYKGSSNMGQSVAASQSAMPSAAAQRNQVARDSMSRRGGLMGMLGGLALGGLLGAMLFGGAFENLNLMDLLVFAAVAFMLYKLFAARRQTATNSAYQRQGQDARPAVGPAGFDTDILARNAQTSVSGGFAQTIPSDFDQSAFLSGATAAYRQLQAAWDKGDLSDLRGLTTDKVFSELQDQIKQRSGENITELLKVEAKLIEVKDVGSDRHASVMFDTVIRESALAEPAQVKEVWHFIRSRQSAQPTWFLDGIQQVEV